MSTQQKVVKSSERSTGMGATSYTAIAQDGQWIAVSQADGRVYCGRDNGWENYKVTVPANTIHADFYRSNRGKTERVTIYYEGSEIEVNSFELANEWLKEIQDEKVIRKRTDLQYRPFHELPSYF